MSFNETVGAGALAMPIAGVIIFVFTRYRQQLDYAMQQAFAASQRRVLGGLVRVVAQLAAEATDHRPHGPDGTQ